MKPALWMIALAPLALTPSAHAANQYEACVQAMAQGVLAQTGLNPGPAAVTDYSHFLYSSSSSTGKSSSPHTFVVQAKTDRTKLAFVLEVRLADVKRSEFGSGQATVTHECCALQNEVAVKDLGSGLTKKFSLRSDSCSRPDWAKGADVVGVSYFQSSLCSQYGKKIENWSTERTEQSEGRMIRVPCGEGLRQVCEEWEPGEYYKVVTRYTGCRLAR